MRNTAEIAAALEAVRERIRRAASAAGRAPEEVRLLAVSKTQPREALEAALAAGQRAFGENYLQDALPKIEALAGRGCEWHFIGQLQSNKTRPVAEHFDWAHTVARAKIARRLSAQRPAELAALNVCVQVNLDADPAKGGCPPEAAQGLAEEIAALPRLRYRGLMCIPRAETDPAPTFGDLAELARRLADAGLPGDTLSMGMSGDLEAAVAAGSTLVRIGTAIFGARG